MSVRKSFHSLPDTKKPRRGFSVVVSSDLILHLLCSFRNFFFSSERSTAFSFLFSDIKNEFTDKLSPSALKKRLYCKKVLGAKIIFYYED